MSWLSKAWRGLKKVPIVGGVVKGAESGVRGLSNVVSGDWDKNVLGDLMGGVGAAATVLGIPGLAGAGPLGGLLGLGKAGKLGQALRGAGGLLGLGGGGGGAAGAAGEAAGGGGGLGGLWDSIKGGLGSVNSALGGGGGDGGGGWLNGLLKLGGLGLGAADVMGARGQRKSAEKFQKGQLDALTQFMGKGEASWDKRQGLRDEATAKIQQGMKRPGVFARQLGL